MYEVKYVLYKDTRDNMKAIREQGKADFTAQKVVLGSSGHLFYFWLGYFSLERKKCNWYLVKPRLFLQNPVFQMFNHYVICPWKDEKCQSQELNLFSN